MTPPSGYDPRVFSHLPQARRLRGQQEGRPLTSLDLLAGALFLNDNPDAHWIMLSPYFDESGTDGRDVLVVAGLMAPLDAWRRLEDGWRRVLTDEGLSSFHMAEFAHSHGEFAQGWEDKADRDRLMRSLIDLICSNVSHRIWTALFFDDYRTADPKLKYAYTFCAAGCASRVRAELEHMRERPHIPYVFEQGGRGSKRIFNAFDDLMARKHRDFYHMAALSKLRSKDCPALQAADLHAWETRKYFADQLAHEDRPRESFKRLLGIPEAGGGGYVFDEAAFARMNEAGAARMPGGVRFDPPIDQLNHRRRWQLV